MRPEQTTDASGDDAGPADELGPVLLEQRPKPLAADLFLILAALFLIPTALMPFVADFRTGVVAGPICAALGALFGMFGILYIVTNAGKASYLHEGGLRVREGKGWRVVRNRDVAEMTFRATRMYYNGVYTGTSQEIGLRTDEAGVKPVVFRHVYKENKTGMAAGYGEATPLNHLCNVLTAQIGRRIADQVRRGESVPWGKGLWINGRGVEVAGRGGREEVEWDRIARVDLDRGVFRLWVQGEAKPRVQFTVGEPNFFPGYTLVAERLRGQPAGGPPAGVTPAPAAAPTSVAATPTVPEQSGSFQVEYTPTVDDQAALTRWHYTATREGRKAWAGRVWPFPLILIALGIVVGLINVFNKDIPDLNGAAALMLLVGLLLRPLIGWLLTATDRARLGRELRAAQQLALQGQGADPFAPRTVVLGPAGYWLRTPDGELRRGWHEVSRVEWFDGYVFVFLAANRLRREATGLIVPTRAFRGVSRAYEAYERIQEWHEAAAPASASLDPQTR